MEDQKICLDLACGNNKKEGFTGLDIHNGPEVDIVHDLNTFPYPFEDNSVDEIHCAHYIEHIPHKDLKLELQLLLAESSTFEEFQKKFEKSGKEPDLFITFINELYRILKPDGKITLIAPYYTSVRFYGDPTHVRPIAESTFWYVNKQWRSDNKLTHYGINCNFEVKFSYLIVEELTLKSDQVRQNAVLHDWNAVEDIIVELIKK